MTETAENCLFCRIANGEIPAKKIYEDDHSLAFEDINPQAPTHVLVIPKEHIPSLDDMTEEHADVIGRTMLSVAAIARRLQLPSDGYRVVVNNGPGAGQTVYHIHFHLLGGRMFGWPPG